MTNNVINKPITRQSQVNQTKTEFLTALIKLLQTNNITNLHVSDLTTAAGYSRRTFYRHFSSLEDVLKNHTNYLILILFKNLYHLDLSQSHFQEFVQEFFSYWKNQKLFLKILHDQNMFYLLQQACFENIDKSKLSTLLHDNENFDFIIYFALSGMFSLLKKWVDDNFQKSIDDMKQIARDIQKYIN